MIQRLIIVFSIFFAVSNCGYNQIQQLDEEVKASWAQVLNQYKRRSDLVPQLVSTVKGVAAQEKEVFKNIADARAKMGSIQATPELLNNPEAFAKFTRAQGELGGYLSRLMSITENYPVLKSNDNFTALQAQLEGTENRISVERKRFIDKVAEYNIFIRQFPTLITAKIFGYQTKPTFQVEDEKAASEAPKIEF